MNIVKGPYLQKPEKDSIIICWQTDCEAVGQLKVYPVSLPHVPKGKWSEYGEAAVFTGVKGTLHKIKADHLYPGQEYCYEVSAESETGCVQSEKYIFRTAPNADEAINFVLTAEHGGCCNPQNPYAAPITELIRRERPDFLLSAGDLISNGTDESDWQLYLFGPFASLLHTTPLFPCVGNHEVGTNAITSEAELWRYDHFRQFFAFTPYYSFDYGCAHFCVLDCPSMFDSIGSSEEDHYIPHLREDFLESEQYRFLKEDLAKADARWKFVVFHYPPYTSAWYDVRQLRVLTPLFEQYGVDIVFNSHAIIYERSHPIREGKLARDGVRYILAGGYGDYDTWIREKTNRLSAKVAARPNYVHISLTPWRFELQAIDYEGKLFDTLTLEKP